MHNLPAFLMFVWLVVGRPIGVESADQMAVCIVVQHEAGGLSVDYRANIAEIILNRQSDDRFPDDIYGILTAKNQFTGFSTWVTNAKWLPTEETVEAVQRAYNENIHDCVYYYNPKYASRSTKWWFENSGDVEYGFSIEETSWGITYETRFFK